MDEGLELETRTESGGEKFHNPPGSPGEAATKGSLLKEDLKNTSVINNITSEEKTLLNKDSDLKEDVVKAQKEDDESEGQDEGETEHRPKQHVVKEGETLVGIAAMYDVTPSQFAQHNKLGMSRMVFPGQVLQVPPAPPPAPPPAAKPPAEDMEVIEYQFIKLKVRHITSGRGVVGGSILFTPNAVIFDPDPTDPLVEELEPEAFQIIAPMEFVVNAAIFLDFFPIGNTGRTAGREEAPAQIFRLGEGGRERRKHSPDAETRNSNREDKSKEGERLGRSGLPSSSSSYSLSREMEHMEMAHNGAEADCTSGAENIAPVDKQGERRSEPYYLRLTMGRPVGRPVSRSTPTMAYGLQTMMPEYWFIVPSLQVENLYNYFQTWFPEIYSSFDLEEIHEMGFELVSEPDLSRSEKSDSVNTASRMMIHKTMTLNSIDLDMLIPDMDVKSSLVSDDQRKLLYRHLPPRIQGSKWQLLFSTAQDGFSLHNLYRKAAPVDSPVLLIVQDTDHAVFGALLSCPPVMSETFLGTGESWLFTFFPTFRVYGWTGENNFIFRGGMSSLVVGSSEGHFGLWLDENFNLGRSMSVSTFRNKPLPGKEDFVVNNIECWMFQ